MAPFGLVSKQAFQRLVNTERRVKDLEDAIHALSAWKPPSTTRGNFRQGVFEEDLTAPASVTAPPTTAKFRVYRPEEPEPGEQLEEIEDDETDLLDIYNHDPNFTASKGDYARVRTVQNEWQVINSGGAALLKFGRITGYAAEAIATVEVTDVNPFALGDMPLPDEGEAGSGENCPDDDEVPTSGKGKMGSYAGEATGETVYAFAGEAFSLIYRECSASAASDGTCGCIVMRTPWYYLRDLASGSIEPGASGSDLQAKEPLYVIVEADAQAFAKSFDIVDCCGSDVDSGVLEKIGEWQGIFLGVENCCQVGECGTQASGCAT